MTKPAQARRFPLHRSYATRTHHNPATLEGQCNLARHALREYIEDLAAHHRLAIHLRFALARGQLQHPTP